MTTAYAHGQPCSFIPGALWSGLSSRVELARLLNERGLTGYAAEIGTHRGEFAAALLSMWRGHQLWCVDPWQDDLPGYGDLVGRDRRQDYGAAVVALRPFGLKARICIGTSEQAANFTSASSLDFAYIDANHAEPFFRRDVALWWPKIRPGGMLAGHDIMKCGPAVDAGIQRVVAELAERENLQTWIVDDPDPNFPWSWFVWKEGGGK